MRRDQSLHSRQGMGWDGNPYCDFIPFLAKTCGTFLSQSKTEGRMDLEDRRNLLELLVPEVGIEPTRGGSPAGF